VSNKKSFDRIERRWNFTVISGNVGWWKEKEKADGTVAYRFCVDLEQIHSKTNKGSYSLPWIFETV
jgi:hypothetical protein